MRIVAYMDNRRIEVAQDDLGHPYYRERGKRKWHAVHYGENPDVDTYLARCAGNFGYNVEKVS